MLSFFMYALCECGSSLVSSTSFAVFPGHPHLLSQTSSFLLGTTSPALTRRENCAATCRSSVSKSSKSLKQSRKEQHGKVPRSRTDSPGRSLQLGAKSATTSFSAGLRTQRHKTLTTPRRASPSSVQAYENTRIIHNAAMA